MPIGPLNCADAAAPSAQPAVPVPATVLTAPASDTARTRLPLYSVTKRVRPLITTSMGLLKDAAAPEPSAHAPAPLPASVPTSPASVTVRTRWLLNSQT